MSAVMPTNIFGTLRNGVPKEVDYRLEAWSRWSKEIAQTLGWPAETLLSRVIEYGPRGASSGEAPPVEMPDAVAEVDRIIAKMPQDLKRVLTVYYLTWAPMQAKARDCRMSQSKYRNRLEVAQWYVYARLQV